MVGPHEMVVVNSEAGAEEWTCPRCERRILLRWPPHHERVVLHAGDDRVVHVGGRVPDAAPSASPAGEPSDREQQWLSGHGITWN